MHKAARDDRVESIDGRGVAGPGRGRSPEWRDIGTDAHSVDDSDRLSEWTTASEDEYVLAGARANSLEAAADRFTTRHVAIVTTSRRAGRVKKIEFQIRVAKLAGELSEQVLQMCAEAWVARVERVCERVVARGPVDVVPGAHRFASLLVYDEPFGMLAHHARIARGKERRGPEAGLETGGANFVGDFSKPARKLGVGRVPVAECRLEAVVELDQLE